MPREPKIRHVNYAPDEFLAGTIELSDTECGIYWRLCTLIYSRGRAVSRDELRRITTSHGRTINFAVTRLIGLGKVVEIGGRLLVERCARELENASKRSRNAVEMASKRWRNDIETKAISAKTNGLGDHAALLTTNNQQPTTKERDAREARSVSLKTEFAEWWVAYPHKVGKGAAERSFATARKQAELSVLMAGVRGYIQAKPEDRPWCNPATWLNQRRWEDQPAPSLLAPQGGIDDIIRVPTQPAPTVEQVYGRRSLDDPLSGHQDRR